MKTRSKGFTLIELMIVVAIVAVLAAIAYPSYKEHVRKGRRADAQAVLVESAQYMERLYSEHFSYLEDREGNNLPGLPDSLTRAPKKQSATDVNGKFYEVQLAARADTTFSLEAVPLGDQTDDRCGTLTLDNTGKKGTKVTGMSVSECWN